MSDWPTKKLEAMCEINPRQPHGFERADDALTTFVPMSAVAENGEGIASAKQRPYAVVRKGYTYFAENDVLFAKITPCMQNGKHAVARDLIDDVGFGSTEFHVFRTRDGVLSKWIFYAITRPEVLRDAAKHLVGVAGQQRVPADYLAELEIPLPPLPEQKRIVGILDEADRLRKLRKQADIRTRDLLPALFLQMFGDPQTNPRGWNIERLGDLLTLNQSGVWGETPNGVGDVDVLRSTNVLLDGAWVFDDVARRSLSADEREKFVLKESDILIVKSSGSEQHIGKMALVDPVVAARGAVFANFMQRLRCDPEKLNARFLHSFLMLPTTRKQILQASATTTGLRNLKPRAIDNLRIPVPPLDLQQKFSAIVTETEQQIEKQKQSAQRLEDLFQSLLHECFA